ncbi:MAG: 4a-hydroxytetrahydrobiopterin dehydratase [Alphaproteobacteria bacterium]
MRIPTNWQQSQDSIIRDLTFIDHASAFSFLTWLAITSDKLDHHCEITHLYNRVALKLTTHDAQQVTEKDIDLAEKINDFLREQQMGLR